ncbi:synaptobrevin protein, partial [Cystoisospora suis]
MWASRFSSGATGGGSPPAGAGRSSRGQYYDENSSRTEVSSSEHPSPSYAILYACITKGTYVQAEYTAVREGEEEVLSSVSRRALLRLPKTQGRRSYVFDNRLFNFLVDDKSGSIFMCVTNETVQADLPWQFLSDLRSQLRQLDACARDGIASETARLLIRLVDAYNRGQGKGTQQMERVEKELEAVTEIVRENINKVLERGEQIECLVGKTSNLRDSAYEFRKASRDLARHMWWSTAKPYFVVFGVILVLIIFLTSFLCGGLTFQNCLR